MAALYLGIVALSPLWIRNVRALEFRKVKSNHTNNSFDLGVTTLITAAKETSVMMRVSFSNSIIQGNHDRDVVWISDPMKRRLIIAVMNTT